MREILFRGKHKNGKEHEWVYGFLGRETYHNETNYVITDVQVWEDAKLVFKSAGNTWEVLEETVGQYAGLHDKSGKRIFEGDILKIAKLMDSLGTYFDPPLEYPCNVLVKWDRCAWCWETIEKEKYFIHFPDAWCHYECEVIGNIYDNPELLEK